MRQSTAVAWLLGVGPALTFQVPPVRPAAGTRLRAVPGPKELPAPTRLPDLAQSEFPDVQELYDLVVLGSGPGGEAAAVQASRLGATVAVVEIKKSFGGPTGLTSKAVREATKQIVQAVAQVGGDRRRQIRRLWRLRFPSLRTEAEVLQAAETRDRLAKNNVDLFIGKAELLSGELPEGGGSMAVRVCRPKGCVELVSQHVCVATGSRPARPDELRPGVKLPFTPGKVIDATEMGKLSELPNAVAILGGGVIAVEYATVLAKLGVGVSLLCPREGFMAFLPEELRGRLRARMARDRILFVEAPVSRVDVGSDGMVRVLLEKRARSPRRLIVDLVLYSGGRNANSDTIGCDASSVEVGRYGRIKVDENYRTTNPHVYAVGDVVGPPGLASAAQQQARYVAELLFRDKMQRLSQLTLEDVEVMEGGLDDDFFAEDVEAAKNTRPDDTPAEEPAGELFGKRDAPLTLWTIPEIATVGTSVEQALEQGLRLCENAGSLVTGYAYFKDLARGRLSGGDGFLKLIARADRPRRHTVIGCQILGEGANELIQIGSLLVHGESTLEMVSSTPFAAVTLSGLYQMASDDALCNSPYNMQRHPTRKQAYKLKEDTDADGPVPSGGTAAAKTAPASPLAEAKGGPGWAEGFRDLFPWATRTSA